MSYKALTTPLLLIIFCFQLTSVGTGNLAIVPEMVYGKLSPNQELEQTNVSHSDYLAREASDNPRNIIFTGDVMLARNVEKLSRYHGLGYPFSAVKFNDLASNPLVVGNFEGSVPKSHQPTPNHHLRFSIAQEHISPLLQAGFTHLSLANNHAYDFGKNGFLNTKEVLNQNDLVAAGHPTKLNQDSVTFLNTGSSQVAVVAIHTLTKYPSQSELQKVMTYARENSDAQVAYIHWGEEYKEESSKGQQILAEQLVQEGIDLVVGHHPHVVQEVSYIDDVPVFYSLGNYIFDQYFSENVQIGLLVELDLSGFEKTVKIHPVTSLDSLSKPKLMNDAEKDLFLQNLAHRSNEKIRSEILAGEIPVSFDVATSEKLAMIGK